MRVPTGIIHYRLGFSLTNHPAIGVLPWLWKPPCHKLTTHVPGNGKFIPPIKRVSYWGMVYGIYGNLHFLLVSELSQPFYFGWSMAWWHMISSSQTRSTSDNSKPWWAPIRKPSCGRFQSMDHPQQYHPLEMNHPKNGFQRSVNFSLGRIVSGCLLLVGMGCSELTVPNIQ